MPRSTVSQLPHCSWSTPQQLPTMSSHTAHVWCVPLNTSLDIVNHYQSLLSTDEVTRAQRFRFERDQHHFIISRGTLRRLLSHYTHIPAQKLIFNYSEYGKPELLPSHALTLQFNVSHSAQLALIAVTTKNSIGVDIEYTEKSLDWANISKRFFSDQEVQAIFALPTPQQKTAFFNCWTRKESFIKARGEGLSYPLKNFSVSVMHPAKLCFCAETSALEHWSLQHLAPANHYTAALTTTQPTPNIHCQLWSHQFKHL